jgi:hypothetical protein
MRRLGVAMPERRCLRHRAPWPRADIVAVLADADPPEKRAMYDELGVNLTHHPDGWVHVGAGARVLVVRVGGGTCGLTPRPRLTRSVVLSA